MGSRNHGMLANHRYIRLWRLPAMTALLAVMVNPQRFDQLLDL